MFASYTGSAVDAGTITRGLGVGWETPNIGYKLYPACQLSHASLDAVRSLGPVEPSAVASILFSVPEEAVPIVCEPADAKRAPRTSYEGKFSLPYCAAVLLLDGKLDISSFDAPSLARPDVLALGARVRWDVVPFAGAPADAPGDVVVELRDGTALKGHVAHSRGGPDLPAGKDDVLEKFHANGGSDRIARELLDLPRRRDVRGIL
ncbi:MAG: hypothetical protein ABR552_04155 [Actinomycetota bacterium]